MGARWRIVATSLAVAALLPLTASADLGAGAVVEEHIVIEADITSPVSAHLRATLRVRRFAAAYAGTDGRLPYGNLDEQTSTIELCDGVRGCQASDALLCWASAPVAVVYTDSADAGEARARAAGCDVTLTFVPTGPAVPFVQNASSPDPSGPKTILAGYRRSGRALTATIGGIDATVTAVTITRLRYLGAAPVLTP